MNIFYSECSTNYAESMENSFFSHSSIPKIEKDISLMEESSNCGINIFDYDDGIVLKENENSLIPNQFLIFSPKELRLLNPLKEEEKINFLENKDIINQTLLIKEYSSKKSFAGNLTAKKRSNKNKDNLNKKEKKKHDKFSSDNLLRKIQVNYLSFIIYFLNDILKNFNYQHRFLKLDYEFKKQVKKNSVDSLKNKSIEEIVSNKISEKYRKHDENINKNICEILKKDDVLNNILSEKYPQLFRNIYFNSNRKINLKEYGMNREIVLSKNVKMFKDFIKRFDQEKEYQQRLTECAIKNFFTHLFTVK